MSYDVFISYRRSGGEHAAKMIRDSLVEAGYKVFFDIESLRAGNFNTKIYSVIDECTDFILVLSPNALDRCSDEKDWVRREVEYALSKNKNIIPILLKGFSFDCELPDSMKILPQLNGIEASSDFYDAFIEKLREFMKSRRSHVKSFTNNKFLNKIPLIFLAIALISGIILGINHFSGVYPLTKSQKNLTDEVVYYVGTNLTYLEIMTDSASDAIDATERQIYADSADFTILENALEVSRQRINSVDTSGNAPDEGFIGRLSSSPFRTDDIIAMHDCMVMFKDEWLNYIDFLEYIASNSCYFPKQTKAEILGYYKKYLEDTLNMYACVTNMIFTCVTSESALNELHSEILPGLVSVPLNSQNWIYDYNILKNSENEYYNKLRKTVEDIEVLTGNLNEQTYNTPVYQQTAETTTVPQTENKEIIEKLNQLRKLCTPEEGDSFETLWTKMMHSLENGFYDIARECAAACRKVDEHPNSDIYMDSIDTYIDLMEKEGLSYGCLVIDYYEPDGINELLEIGDIIISADGKEVKSYEEFNEIKAQIPTENYELVVLRLNNSGKPEKVSLDYSKSMPRVSLYNIVNYTKAD